MDWVDAEELAAHICGIGDDYDSDKVEEAIYKKFDCSFDQFHKIAESLLKYTPVVNATLTGKKYHAFITNGFAIAKCEAVTEGENNG